MAVWRITGAENKHRLLMSITYFGQRIIIVVGLVFWFLIEGGNWRVQGGENINKMMLYKTKKLAL